MKGGNPLEQHPVCEHCKEELSDWDGVIIFEKEEEKVRILCKPCLMLYNKKYNGWNRFEVLWQLRFFFERYKTVLEKMEWGHIPETEQRKIMGLHQLAKMIKANTRLGIEEGPSEQWKEGPYTSEEQYYLEKYQTTKYEYFQKPFEEWTTYFRFLQLIQMLIMKTEGPDHRYYIQTSYRKKEKIVDKWFQNLQVSEQKKGYEHTKKRVLTEIEKVFVGEQTLEESHQKIRRLLYLFFQQYEHLTLDLERARQYEEEDRQKRKKGIF